MVTSRALYLVFLALIAAERLVELVISRGNAARSFARGGIEYGRAHFPALVVMHTAFLVSCAAESRIRPFPGVLGWTALSVAVAAQGLRYWAVSSLGDRWNARVIVVPGDPPVERGPYRLVRHPNYVAIALEMIAVPLVHGCWVTAAVFSLANVALLRVRIRTEEAALGAPWRRAFARRPRFVPGGFGRA
jgi:methyltransferase